LTVFLKPLYFTAPVGVLQRILGDVVTLCTHFI
jgi:hypothetical protein